MISEGKQERRNASDCDEMRLEAGDLGVIAPTLQLGALSPRTLCALWCKKCRF